MLFIARHFNYYNIISLTTFKKMFCVNVYFLPAKSLSVPVLQLSLKNIALLSSYDDYDMTIR